MVFSFGASLFGNKFIFRNQLYVTKPSQAYRLRESYAQNYGPFGDNFIETVSWIYLGMFDECMKIPKILLSNDYSKGIDGSGNGT